MRPPGDTAETFDRLVSEGRRGDAVEFFMAKVVGMPAEFVQQARTQPWWTATESLAHTLAYDARIMGDYSPPLERAGLVAAHTIVLTGGISFPFMHQTAQALAKALPHGEVRTLEGQTHDVAPDALAPALVEFFTS